MDADYRLARQALSDVFGVEDDHFEAFETIRPDLSIAHLAVGDVLVREGSPSDALYILLRGRLAATIQGADGTARFVGEIRRGETIGETGLVMEAPRNATVSAARTSTVARIGADAFGKLLKAYPDLGLAIARTLISREARNAGPRHPGFVPQTLALVQVTNGIDLDAVAQAMTANFGTDTAVIAAQNDIEAGRDAIHAAEREGKRVLIPCTPDNAEWRAMAVSEADEVVRVADAGQNPSPADFDLATQRGEDAVLPRHTLLLVHPDTAQSPTGTKHWLAPRKLDRHLHVRLGNPQDLSRLGRILSGRAVGLVLAGGGARGAAHLGAFKALEDAGITLDIVGGTSIGAAMAAWYAMGLRGTELEAAARKVFVESGGPTSDWNILPLMSLVKGKRTRALGIQAIREAAGSDIDIEDTWTPFFCVAANYSRQQQTVLQRGLLSRALTASYAIPGVLPPVPVDGGLHVDGGVVNNLPVDVLESVGAAATIAVDLMGAPRRPLDIEKLPGTMALLLDKLRPRRKRKYRLPGILSIMLNSTVLSSLERQREMGARADLCLKPDLPRVGLLDWGKFPRTIELGYASAQKLLGDVDHETLTLLREGPATRR